MSNRTKKILNWIEILFAFLNIAFIELIIYLIKTKLNVPPSNDLDNIQFLLFLSLIINAAFIKIISYVKKKLNKKDEL